MIDVCCLKDVLHIRLHGGFYVYGPQKADIQFVCDHDADEVRSCSISDLYADHV